MRVLRSLCPVLLTVVTTLSAAHAVGGEAEAAQTVSANFQALAAYYQGHWQCEGHFANGTPISSDEQFEPWLNGAWLHELHDDKPPFPYHAHSIWGVDKASGALTLTIHDNFGAVRVFSSADWKGYSITFDAQSPLATPGKRERFVYLRQPPTGFSFEYQVATDGGTWRMGDHVECKKSM
jgi:hypothetical protein